MISDSTQREDELSGKTLLIIGLGSIGSRLAQLAKAFGLRVIGIKRNPATGGEAADSTHGLTDLKTLLPQADFVVLSCPLNEETEKVIDADAFSRMKQSAYLVNVARGRCVDELALIKALQDQMIAGAAIDVTVEEPLPATSPLWDLSNVLITPHTAGETRKYEDTVLDILVENVNRLWRGEVSLRNEISKDHPA
jgi:phosphoglycerate dehydrogenase-like enzyme